jgi:hypothetical protein
MSTETNYTTDNPKPDGFYRVLLLSAVILFILLFALCGCSPKAVREQHREAKQLAKHRRQAVKQLRKHDRIEARCAGDKWLDTVKNHWCMINAPIRKEPGKIIRVPGKPIHDTTPGETKYVNCDSLKLAGVNTSHVGVPCPPSTHTRTTDVVVKEVIIFDTNKERLLAAERDGWIDQASKYKQKYESEQRAHAVTQAKVSKRNYWIGGLGGFCLLLLFLLVGGVMGKISHPIGWFKSNG